MIKNIRDFFFHTLLLLIGSALCAAAVNGILIPQEFLSSGLTGATLIFYYKYPVVSVGVLYLLINIPVFFLGWFFVGFRFILYTAWGMLIYSVMLYVLTIDLGITDKMLGAVVAGGMTGVGVAIMLRSYGSAGGSEVLCVILHKLFSLTLGTGTVIVNAVILLGALILFPLETILYTLIFIIVSAFATNMVFHGIARRRVVLIISDKWQDIVNDMTNVNRMGVTLFKGKGGYQGTEKTILYSIIKRKHIHSLKSLIAAKDPNAFVAIMDAVDVNGEKVGNQPHW
jgi:uncharacterized membrane-anchored protein YitT (DUF2179 family)